MVELTIQLDHTQMERLFAHVRIAVDEHIKVRPIFLQTWIFDRAWDVCVAARHRYGEGDEALVLSVPGGHVIEGHEA